MTVVKRERSCDALEDTGEHCLSPTSSGSEIGEDNKWIVTIGSNSSAGKVESGYDKRESLTQPLQISANKYKEEMRKRRMTGKKSQLCQYTLDRVQGILLSQRISSYIPVSTDNLDDDTGKETFRHPSRIPLIKGLERVASGAQPASEVVATCGMKPHRFIWFMISGCICDVVQFFIDLSLFHILHIKSTSICWLLGYGLSIVVRHTSHRYLVFGKYVGGYCHSLLRMYAGYSISLVLSTLFNLAATKLINLTHYTAWIITVLFTQLMNYFLLKRLWSWDWSKSKKSASVSRRGKDSRTGEVV